MWYYKFLPTLKNFHKIIFYVLISFVQVKSNKTFTKYKFIDLQKSKVKNNFFLQDIKVCKKKSNNCDCLLLLSEFNFLKIIRNIRYLKRLRIYDMDYFAHFGLTMILKIQYFDFTDINLRSKFIKDSFENLELLKKSSLKKNLYLIGNNPNYSEKKKNILGNLVVICNDAIKDVDLINKNQVILAVADPLFFFSETEYSINFFNNLKKVESKIYYLVIPTITIPILKKLNISTPIIGINSSRFQNKLYQIKDGQIISKKTHNIFTQYMLPLAMYLNLNTYIGGFTLRNKEKENRLWSYDSKVVEDNSKSFAFRYSFFKHRNFKKYYKSHYYYINKFLKNKDKVYEL